MAERNLDKLIQELRSDELDQSIEIVKQLQNVLVNANGRETVGQLPEIIPDVKQEKGSGTALSNPGKSLSQELRYDETDFSIAIVKLLQKSFGATDETEKQGESSQSDQEIEEEKLCQTALSGSVTCLEQNYPSQDFSGKYTDSQLRSKEDSERPCECKFCGSKFMKSDNLKRHMRIHTGERPFECKSCGSKFNQAGDLKMHMRIHTGERPVECKSCGSKFIQAGYLKKHMRIHTGERPFECKSCGSKYTESGALKIHMRIHTSERPFECKSCGSKFIQAGDLKKHMRIHTGERPFECKFCVSKFTESGPLKKHMRIHTGERPFECKSCGSKFTQSGALKTHMRIHTGERQHECKSC